ncbi:hypothetical protein [Mucilaginibacter sp.]
MHRIKTLIIAFVYILNYSVSAQTVNSNLLYGVWRSEGYHSAFLHIYSNAFVFQTDSIGYLTTSQGIVQMPFNYHIDNSRQPVWFDYTIKGLYKFKSLIRAVNDSTIMIDIGNTDKRPDVKMKRKKVLTYHKLKNFTPESFMHPFNNDYLLGTWIVNSFNNKGIVKSVQFKNDHLVLYTNKDEDDILYKYVTDLSVVPKLINLKNAGNAHLFQGFIELLDDTTLHIELFNYGKRPSHWTMFGNNTVYIRKK